MSELTYSKKTEVYTLTICQPNPIVRIYQYSNERTDAHYC